MPKRAAKPAVAPLDLQEDAANLPEDTIVHEDSSDTGEDIDAHLGTQDDDDVEPGLTGLDAVIAAARARHHSSPAARSTLARQEDDAAADIYASARVTNVSPSAELAHEGSPSAPPEQLGLPEDRPAGQIRRISRKVPKSSLLRDEAFLADEGSDSSEDERPNRNTVGNVPLEWYNEEEHIGYDREGAPIQRKGRSGDMLDAVLRRNDAPGAALRTLYDPYNDEEITLSRQELRTLLNIQQGKLPDVRIDPYSDHVDWYSNTVDPFPVRNAPEPKSRFRPSAWEEQKVVKLVRAMRRGWIKPASERQRDSSPPPYLLWDDAGTVGSQKTGAGLTRLPPPKPDLPGNAESYNPPREYLPTEEERAAHAAAEAAGDESAAQPLPQAFESLRQVPQFPRFVQERFERCLDLYLCPRVRNKRRQIKPEDLVPKAIPKPSELRPFPNKLCITYSGHRGKVTCVSPDSTGQWLLTGSEDGSMRLWEALTGRCCREWQVGHKVTCVAWCPNPALRLVSCTASNRLMLFDSGVGPAAVRDAAAAALELPEGKDEDAPAGVARWTPGEQGGVEIVHNHRLRSVHWHSRGDYFVASCPGGASQSVVVHQLSKRTSQNPFRKNKGKVTGCQFHPSKPLLLVAAETNVRIYNLAKQALAKTLLAGGGVIASMHVHPSGDHVLVGTEDQRCLWFDLDLSSKPYKVMKYHTAVVRSVSFHAKYPLFASASDDGSIQVFHGMVYSDLLSNPLIVPVKTLSLHTVHDYSGVSSIAFHPSQPWIFSAGGDGKACLTVDV